MSGGAVGGHCGVLPVDKAWVVADSRPLAEVGVAWPTVDVRVGMVEDVVRLAVVGSSLGETCQDEPSSTALRPLLYQVHQAYLKSELIVFADLRHGA